MKTHHRVVLPAILSMLMLGACGSGSDSASATTDPASGGAGGQTVESAPQPALQVPAGTAPLQLALQRVATGLSTPLYATAPKGDTRLFIVERSGRVKILKGGSVLPVPFINISSRTTTDGERGLLSIAFDPQYQANGFFYLYFTDLAGDITVERHQVSSADPDLADPGSGLRIISIPHPTFSNHNGGLLRFGLDGFLYVGTGDGGGAGDPQGNARNTSVLLGKLLRLDVSVSHTGQPYTVPASNPFAGQGQSGRPEIWAYGLRNPWRYTFDAPSNLLYIADVGQAEREEVNVVRADEPGLDYGWNLMEGSLCVGASACDSSARVIPALEYAHGGSNGSACSIIGGMVYRGAAIPQLQGTYLYTDLCAGWIRGFRTMHGAITQQLDFGMLGTGTILSFGEDALGELYLLSAQGNVDRLIGQ